MEYKEKQQFEEIARKLEEVKKIVYNIEGMQALVIFPPNGFDNENIVNSLKSEIKEYEKDYRNGLREIHRLIEGLI